MKEFEVRTSDDLFVRIMANDEDEAYALAHVVVPDDAAMAIYEADGPTGADGTDPEEGLL